MEIESLKRYSIVIATMDRPEKLRNALKSVAEQTYKPTHVVIVDASESIETKTVTSSFSAQLSVEHRVASEKSAALQRNQGTQSVDTPLVAYMDDDVVLEHDVFEKLATIFAQKSETAGVAARMRGFGHKPPSALLHLYYRIQAGYFHPTYGGKLFGPAINCLPCYEENAAGRDLLDADWLPAGVVLFSTEAVRKCGTFPAFHGYSFMEDVYLSGKISQNGRLFFHQSAWYDHYPTESRAKQDKRALSRMRIRNHCVVARDILKISGLRLWWKLQLLKIFMSIAIVRQKKTGRWSELFGVWF